MCDLCDKLKSKQSNDSNEGMKLVLKLTIDTNQIKRAELANVLQKMQDPFRVYFCECLHCNKYFNLGTECLECKSKNRDDYHRHVSQLTNEALEKRFSGEK